MDINNKEELFSSVGDRNHIKRTILRKAGCDRAWVDVDDARLSMIATIEGKDDEVAKHLYFPFNLEDYNIALEELAQEVTWL